MRSVVWGFVLVLAACGGGDDSSGTPNVFVGGNNVDAGDASVPATDGGAPSCGTKSCKAGEYCCDGKCGACAPVGMSCPAHPCQ
jgi:hypothetical protein